MGLGHYLFGFSGRINRAKQWAIFLVIIGFGIAFWALFAGMVGFGTIADLVQKKLSVHDFIASAALRNFLLVAGALYLLMFYASLAITTKRLHDRNKSAWWLLVFIVLPLVLQVPVFMAMPAMFAQMAAAIHAAQNHLPPPPPPFESPVVLIARGAAAIINLWAFVELYILRGTVGDNRFGPDPLAGRG